MSQNPGTGGTAVAYDPAMETPVAAPAKALTAADRCDRCGAQALFYAELESLPDLELLFCAHHTAEQREPLEVKGWRIFASAAA